MYREHIFIFGFRKIHDGLSLCVQGTRALDTGANLLWRFIPVCTGNTLISRSSSGMTTVYPCVYREHIERSQKTQLICGLSLCVQGTHQL